MICNIDQEEMIHHYDALIDENNDPVHDPLPLKAYMDKWDGEAFIETLRLSPDKSVLEVGVGTGRLAVHVCGKCGRFTGIDISPKTIERAKENLRIFPNACLIRGDFLSYSFNESFDVIYSSLTFMHIKDKQAAFQKVESLLNPGGRFVLSIDKNQQTEIDYGTRRIPVFPDTPKEIDELLTKAGFIIEQQIETEFAVIFAAVKEVAI
jgi:ubiquinone/menaquinone biosynthesis C-methylase UbiE